MGMPAASADLATRSRVGFEPTRPQQAAGIPIEPPPSLACAIGRAPAATSAADPPDDAPAGSRCSTDCASGTVHIFGGRGQTEGRQGRRTGMLTPVASNWSVNGSLCPAGIGGTAADPCCVGIPAKCVLFLIMDGTPRSSPSGRSPFAARASPRSPVVLRHRGQLRLDCVDPRQRGTGGFFRRELPCFNRLGDAHCVQIAQAIVVERTDFAHGSRRYTDGLERSVRFRPTTNTTGVSKNHAPETIRRRGRVPRRDAHLFTTQIPADIRERAADGHGDFPSDMVTTMRILNEAGLCVPNWPVEWGGRDWTPSSTTSGARRWRWPPVPEPLAFNAAMVGPVIAEFGTQGAEGAVPAADRQLRHLVVPGDSPSRRPAPTSPR